MKTASLGLLEVMVVRVNAGGDAPPDPPSVGDVTGHSPFLCFLKKRFLANERDIIFGEGVKDNYKKPHKTLTNKWRA
jgi:hypothetical protein